MTDTPPEAAGARELFVRHARRDGRSVAVLRAVDYGDSCVIEAEVYPAGGRSAEPSRPGPRGLGAPAARRIDLGLDDAGVAVIDRAENRYRASIAAGVPDEELARPSGLGGRVRHVPRAAFWAACATVSLSAKPLILATSVPGLV